MERNKNLLSKSPSKGWIFLLLWIFGVFCLPNPLRAGESYRLNIGVDQVSPQTDLTVQTGDTVLWGSETIPATLTLQLVATDSGNIRLVSGFPGDHAEKPFVAQIHKGETAGVQFLKAGIYTYLLEGLNPSKTVLKCGMDVIPHSVIGRIVVSDKPMEAEKSDTARMAAGKE